MAKTTRAKTGQAGHHRRPGKPRPGLPDPGSVVDVTTFKSPAGKTYRILRTSEQDAYDKPPKRTPKNR